MSTSLKSIIVYIIIVCFKLACSKAVALLLLTVVPIAGLCICAIFCCVSLCVLSSFAIILMGKRESWLFFCLSSWCFVVVIVLWLYLIVP